MQKTVAVVVWHTIPAIWYATQKHIDLQHEAGYKVKIFIRTKEAISNEDGLIFHYTSIVQLYKIINLDRSINVLWSPDVFVTILLLGQRFFKHKKIITWIQGTLPEESYMRNKDKLRRTVLYWIEAMGFKISNGFIFVSKSMAEFYRKKHPFGVKKSAAIPCLSDFKESQLSKMKIPNSFVYIGGLAKWQCFEKTIDLYARIKDENSVFHIITLDVDKAKDIVSSKLQDLSNIKIYAIKERNRIPEILSQFERGFLIRENSPVNYVSSPIKFLEYLSCNVDVIMTNAVPSYANIVEKYEIGTVLDREDNFNLNPFSGNAKQVYDKLFSKGKFIEEYKRILD